MKFIDFTRRNIRRTPYQAIAASMVMFLTFLTLIISSLLILGSQRILKYYESKPQAIAFFKDNTPDSDVQAIQKALLDTGKVTNLRYVSKDEALKIYQERNKNTPVLLELVTANILPASLEISTTSPADLSSIGAVLKKEPVVEDVVIPEDAIQGLTRATTVIRWVGSGVAGFLIIFSFFLLLMVIGFKIRLRRGEIEIMKLLGASTWFVRAPFILEGITYGVLGAALAWIISYLVVWYFTPYLQTYLEGVPPEVISLPVSPLLMGTVLLSAVALSALIGALGSFGAVRRYLNV